MSAPLQDPGCFDDAFTAAFMRLRVAVESACWIERTGGDSAWPAQVAAAVCAALEWSAANPDAASALTSKALAGGSAGLARYDGMLEDFAERLRVGRAERPPGEPLPGITEKALVGGLATMIAERVDTGRAAELPAIGPEAVQFVLTPYIGAERARAQSINVLVQRSELP